MADCHVGYLGQQGPQTDPKIDIAVGRQIKYRHLFLVRRHGFLKALPAACKQKTFVEHCPDQRITFVQLQFMDVLSPGRQSCLSSDIFQGAFCQGLQGSCLSIAVFFGNPSSADRQDSRTYLFYLQEGRTMPRTPAPLRLYPNPCQKSMPAFASLSRNLRIYFLSRSSTGPSNPSNVFHD